MRDLEERVILVDPTDLEIGSEEKLRAHERGVLHRAFSVFLLNRNGEILLQRRAEGKYHGAGLWSNSACGHPRPGEDTAAAARRRLEEEMGIDAPLEHLFSFTYRAEMAGGLTEHEIDHVFRGRVDVDPRPDPDEVGEWRWSPPGQILREMRRDPGRYTPWFSEALAGLLERESAAPAPS